ncbi:MAG: GDSL-type esterase/lipase family protein [Actinomycetota bacterium]
MKAAAVVALALLLGAMVAVPAGSRKHHRRPRVFVNGDSLAVGTRPYIPGRLHRFRVRQSTSISRHAPQGVAILRGLRKFPRVVVMSLGTNDDPRQVDAFRAAVRSTVHMAGRRHCVVWPNIVRPAVAGRTYSGYNAVLAEENRRHRNLRVVKWTRMVRRHPYWIGSDGVHPNADGYRSRAAAIAREVRRCVKGLRSR